MQMNILKFGKLTALLILILCDEIRERNSSERQRLEQLELENYL
jgi:hypothetical protein